MGQNSKVPIRIHDRCLQVILRFAKCGPPFEGRGKWIMDFGILPFKTDPYISSTFFGEFQFALRDQSDQESEGAVPVSLRDKD